MAADKNGNIYTDANDGVQELLAVNGVVPANPTVVNIIAQYSSPYTGVFQYPKKLALDSSGDIYIADEGKNVIYEIKAVGGVIPSNPTPIALGSGFSNPYGVAVDASGDVFVADTSNNAIKEMVAVSGAVPTSNPTINTISLGATTCSNPESVSFDTSGNLYTTCTGSNTVLELIAVSGLIPASPTVKTLGSGWSMGYGSDAQVDASGNVYVIDDNVSVGDIKEMVAVSGSIPASPTILTIATNLTQPNDMALTGNVLYWGEENQSNEVKSIQLGAVNFGGVNVGTAATAQSLSFTVGSGITIGSINYITQGASNLDFTSSTGSTCTATTYSSSTTCTINVGFKPTAAGLRLGAVQILDNSTPANVLATVPLSGTGIGPQVTFNNSYYNITGVKSLGTGFSFIGPQNVTVDGSGNVYVADYANTAIFKIPAGCVTSTCVVSIGTSSFQDPTSVAVDGAGNVFVSDDNSQTVKEIVAVGGVITASSTVKSVKNGFGYIQGVAVDRNENVYVADSSNSAIWEIAAVNGVIPASPTATKIASPANPLNVDLDSAGNVYYDDSSHTLYEIAAVNGIIPASPAPKTLLAGFGGYNGIAIDVNGDVFSAGGPDVKEAVAVNGVLPASPVIKHFGTGTVSSAYGVALDASGNIYTTNGTGVNEIPIATPPSLSFATTNIGSTSSDSPNTVTVVNSGNATLNYTTPGVGSTNPILGGSVPASYNLSNSSTCPQVTSSSTPQTLTASSSCTYLVNFKPTATSNAATLILVDSNLNGSNATQSITLSGTGVLALSSFGITALPSTGTAGGTNAFTVTAYSSGTTVATNYTGTITLSSTQDSNIAFKTGGTTYTFVSGDAGVHVFTSSTGAVFQKAGADTLTVTDTSASVAATSGTITIAAGTASLESIPSGATQSTTIGSAFGTALGVLVTDAYANPISGAVVTFTAPSTGATATLSNSGTCTTGSAGTCSVTATANGTASTTSYNVSAAVTGITTPAKFTLTNNAVSPTLVVTALPNTLVYGQPVTITATSVPTSAGGSSPTGAVTFYDNSTTLTPTSTPSAGVSSFSTYALTGSQTYGASTAADTNFNAVSKTTATAIIVSKATSTLTAPTTQPVQFTAGTAGTIPIPVAAQYTFAGITPPSGTLGYTISSPCAANCTGSASLSGGGAAIPIPSTLASGPYTVGITYAGDTNYSAATAINVMVQVGQLTPTVTYPAQTAITYNTALTSNLNATTAYTTTPLTSGGTTTYTATLGSGSPVAVTATTVLTPGTYTLTATWTPNTTNATLYKTATGTTSLVVNKAASSTSIAQTAPLPITGGTGTGVPTTFAVVVSSTAGTPTGTVQFYNGLTAIGSPVTLSVTGGASLTTTFTSVQTASITAQYSGDGNFSTSTSSPFSEAVVTPGYTVAANPTTLTVTRGVVGSATITFNPYGNYQGTATFTCTGLPAFSSCVFTPSSITFTGNNAPQTATLQIYTLAPQAVPGTAHSGLLWIPAMLMGMLLMVRRRKLGTATRALLMLLLLACAAFGVTGCGNGNYSTPVGADSLVVNVTATATTGSGSSNLNQTATIAITVQ